MWSTNNPSNIFGKLKNSKFTYISKATDLKRPLVTRQISQETFALFIHCRVQR